MTEASPARVLRARPRRRGGADGRVLLVRVGWLTPELAAAIADDVRHAPTGTWLEVLVADDVSDAELASLRTWLRLSGQPST